LEKPTFTRSIQLLYRNLTTKIQNYYIENRETYRYKEILGNLTKLTVISTFTSPHKPSLIPKACKRAYAFPARVTAFQDGFRIAHAQKNKINLCFVDRLVQIEENKKIKAK
jgi:hypothetical protein